MFNKKAYDDLKELEKTISHAEEQNIALKIL